MTSASELFYNRRSRFGRNSADLGIDSFSQDRNHGRRGCDPHRRNPHSRNPFINNRASHQERGWFRVDESPAGLFGNLGNRGCPAEDSIGSSVISPSDRLPGAVVLARARLQERLRGLPLTGIGSRGRVISNVNVGGIMGIDSSNHPDASDWEETDYVNGLRSTNGAPSSTYLGSHNTRLQLSREQNNKPCGLTQEALDCLYVEHFNRSKETGVEDIETVSKSAMDCSICLESFASGDELICLPCEHRFHTGCLHPWLQIHGDCPNCRSIIVVKRRTRTNVL